MKKPVVVVFLILSIVLGACAQPAAPVPAKPTNEAPKPTIVAQMAPTAMPVLTEVAVPTAVPMTATPMPNGEQPVVNLEFFPNDLVPVVDLLKIEEDPECGREVSNDGGVRPYFPLNTGFNVDISIAGPHYTGSKVLVRPTKDRYSGNYGWNAVNDRFDGVSMSQDVLTRTIRVAMKPGSGLWLTGGQGASMDAGTMDFYGYIWSKLCKSEIWVAMVVWPPELHPK